MSDPIEEIKSRIDLVDLVKEYFSLTQAGANFKARCPFHGEKTPSFMVSRVKQMWHCFGCSQGGDIFSFFMKQEGLSFGEALRILADRAGVKLEHQDSRVQGEKNRLLSLLDLASHYYYQALLRSPQGAHARAYVQRRGLTQPTIDAFRIGYALGDGGALSQFLLSRRYSAQEVIDAGLALKKDRGYGLFDRFRNRLIIPIRNIYGYVVGFGARILEDTESGPKYLNSPQTALYDKSKIVFGLDTAKQAIRQEGRVVLVEGYMDALSVYQAGTQHVVATSGTALTQDQVRSLKRFTQRFIFSFDTDKAGTGATLRGIECALKEGVDVRVVFLPLGRDGVPLFKDPDECVRKDPAAWQDALEHAISFVEFCFRQHVTLCSSSDAYEKKNATRKMLDVIKLIPDRIEQDHWIKQLARELSLSESILWEEIGRVSTRLREQDSAAGIQHISGRVPSTEELLVGTLLKLPAGISRVKDRLTADMFKDGVLRSIYTRMITFYTPTEVGERAPFIDAIRTDIPERIWERLFFLAEDSHIEGVSGDRVDAALDELASRLLEQYKKRRIQELHSSLKLAEQHSDAPAVQANLEEFERLKDL